MTIKEQVTIEDVIIFLNQACHTDSDAMRDLINCRVPCNDSMRDHPTIQVRGSENSTVGLLGILNGLFGVDDDQWGTISANFEVVCPKDKTHNTLDLREGDSCLLCGSRLIVGDLIGFEDIGRR